jgi:hypothetical protein
MIFMSGGTCCVKNNLQSNQTNGDTTVGNKKEVSTCTRVILGILAAVGVIGACVLGVVAFNPAPFKLGILPQILTKVGFSLSLATGLILTPVNFYIGYKKEESISTEPAPQNLPPPEDAANNSNNDVVETSPRGSIIEPPSSGDAPLVENDQNEDRASNGSVVRHLSDATGDSDNSQTSESSQQSGGSSPERRDSIQPVPQAEVGTTTVNEEPIEDMKEAGTPPKRAGWLDRLKQIRNRNKPHPPRAITGAPDPSTQKPKKPDGAPKRVAI